MTGEAAPGDLRAALSAGLVPAMRARDAVTVSALRSALAALGNAEAVPSGDRPRAGAMEEAALGVGAADVPRRELSEDEVRAVVEQEVAERVQAADRLRALGRPADGERPEAEAAVLRGLLDAARRRA